MGDAVHNMIREIMKVKETENRNTGKALREQRDALNETNVI